jgi:hypothetical protein
LMVHLTAGILALVEIGVAAYRIRRERLPREELRRVYEQQLVARGVPPTVAAIASDQRLDEIVRLIAAVLSETPQPGSGD